MLGVHLQFGQDQARFLFGRLLGFSSARSQAPHRIFRRGDGAQSLIPQRAGALSGFAAKQVAQEGRRMECLQHIAVINQAGNFRQGNKVHA